MDEKFMDMARKRIEDQASVLDRLGRPDKAAEIRAKDPVPVARRLWATEDAQKPEVLAAFKAAHPGFEESDDEPGMWSSPVPLNQAELDAWDAAHNAALKEAESSPVQRTGFEFVASDGSRWRRLDSSVGPDDYGVPMPGSWWKCINFGPRGPRPGRDFGDVFIAEWFLAKQDKE